MLQLKKEAEVLESELKVSNCPICKSYVCHTYFMQDAGTKKKSKWFSCSCGIVYQAQKPTGLYDAEYTKKYHPYDKKVEAAYQYPLRLYMPLIEELVYGRRILHIGSPNTYQSDAMIKRGWIVTRIDKNESLPQADNLIIADFEKHQFPQNVKYNVIWIYHTLECFDDPIASLDLCTKLLCEDGILFIGTPDTDFINTRSSSCFINWKPEVNHIMWNRKSLTRHLDSQGYNVILSRRNYEHRFAIWDDFHIIAQKKFF